MKHKIQPFPTVLKVQTNLQKKVIHLVRTQNIPETNISYPLDTHTYVCVSRGNEMLVLRKIFAYVLHGWTQRLFRLIWSLGLDDNRSFWNSTWLVKWKRNHVFLINAKLPRHFQLSDTLSVGIKVGLSPSKKNLFYLLQWKPFKNGEKCFLFRFKSSFCSQDI